MKKALSGAQGPCNYLSVISEMGVICLLHERSWLLQGFLQHFQKESVPLFLQTLRAPMLLPGCPTLFTDKIYISYGLFPHNPYLSR